MSKDKRNCRRPKTCGDNGWEDMCRPCRDSIDRMLGAGQYARPKKRPTMWVW